MATIAFDEIQRALQDHLRNNQDVSVQAEHIATETGLARPARIEFEAPHAHLTTRADTELPERLNFLKNLPNFHLKPVVLYTPGGFGGTTTGSCTSGGRWM